MSAEEELSPSRRALYCFYGRLQKAIAPGIRYSQLDYLDVLKARAVPGCRWLDLGCGHRMFPDFMSAEERALAARAAYLVGIDMVASDVKRHRTLAGRVAGNIESLPFAPESFDLVTANMVIEHVVHPRALLEQVFGVLRSKGLFIFHTPNRNCALIRMARLVPQAVKNKIILLLERRQEEDVFPTEYRMNTERDILSAAAGAGFEVVELKQLNSAAITALLGPLAIFELLYLRMLENPRLAWLRSNLVVTLRKP
ncbi:MAG TPA: class I SAM-dependent methyltransferase [Bryobacteraceae bacterium]|nr:class I SAM-dependent methyltransferase [Bryobacteraceae bacterium]